MSNESKKLAEEMGKDREIEELRRQLEEAKKAKEEIKTNDQNSDEANAADEPEKVNGTVEDNPKDLPAVKKGVKGKFKDWKVGHPRVSKWIARAGIGAAIVGGWMLGKSQQEKKDAKMIQTAIENGDIVRVNKELEDAEAEGNEEFEE